MNGSSDRSLATHLECGTCGVRHEFREVHSVCTACGKSLLVRYDLDAARRVLSRDALSARVPTMWRYRELLPVEDSRNINSLGEGLTPLVQARRLAAQVGVAEISIKDESFNPTGSFKARGLCVAVARAVELGITEACIPTAGNAGAALAAYSARARLKCHVFMPSTTPAVIIAECRTLGADVHLVDGTISDAAMLMAAERRTHKWFDMSTLKEPYRVEGKKTMGFEVAEQFQWRLPDVIVYPTGGGTGLIGMWKAFAELEALGWLDEKRPKMVAVQSTGCAPVVRAVEQRRSTCERWQDAKTVAAGLCVPSPFADTLMLNVLYESAGTAVAVDDESIHRALHSVATEEGILLCPEGAAALAALPALRETGVLTQHSSVLLFNTGSGLKYHEILKRPQ